MWRNIACKCNFSHCKKALIEGKLLHRRSENLRWMLEKKEWQEGGREETRSREEEREAGRASWRDSKRVGEGTYT